MLQKTRLSLLVILIVCAACPGVLAQDSASAPEPTVKLRYFVNNNSVQYLMVESLLKKGKKFEALPKQVVKVFLDSNKVENMIINTKTDEKGKARVIIPPGFKDQWNSSAKHSFIAVMETPSNPEGISTALEITKAKILLDTATVDGMHNIKVQVLTYNSNEWVPAKDVEMKVGVGRAASILSAGEESYTTDSTGSIAAEFKRDSLPGDQNGNLVLVASVEDNDVYGNLHMEKTVPWARATKPETGFF